MTVKFKLKRWQMIVSAYLVIAGMLSLCMGCFTGMLWDDEDGRVNGSVYHKITNTEWSKELVSGNISLKIEIEYQTQFVLFPALSQHPHRSAWNQWYWREKEQQVLNWTQDELLQICQKSYDTYPIKEDNSAFQVIWDEQSNMFKLKCRTGYMPTIHQYDNEKLSGVSFFLLEDETSGLETIGFRDIKGNFRKMTYYSLYPSHNKDFTVSPAVITAWKIAVTPLNFIADVVTMPGQVAMLIFMKLFLPKDLC